MAGNGYFRAPPKKLPVWQNVYNISVGVLTVVAILFLTSMTYDSMSQLDSETVETSQKISLGETKGITRRLLSEVDVTNSGVSFSGFVEDSACVSAFPTMCKFVNELPVPPEIDVSDGEVLTLGAYNIEQRIHRDLEPTKMYGYGPSKDTATAPGPTLRATRHVKSYVKWENHLVDPEYVFPDELVNLVSPGSIPISMHLHGGETEAPSDGHADGWFTATGEKGVAFVKDVHTHHNGQPPATLWYHDHTVAMTAHNVYFGLAGFYMVHDPLGDDKNLNLPTGKYDIPLAVQNKQLEADGALHSSEHVESVLVETTGLMLVNGMAWPYLNVDRTMYRFRLLNAANLLLLNISFLAVNPATKALAGQGLNYTIPDGTLLPFKQIGCDGGYLNHQVSMNIVLMGPAERVEVLVDFSQLDYQGEDLEVLLINAGDIATSDNGVPQDSNMGVLAKFIIDSKSKYIAPLVVPELLSYVPKASTATSIRTRWLTLTEMAGGDDRIHLLGMKRWTDAATEVVQEGSSEVWALVNFTPQTHTIHLHVTKFQLLSRQRFDYLRYLTNNCSFLTPDTKGSCFNETLRAPTEGSEQGWKDTILVQGYDVTMIVVSVMTQDSNRFPFDPTLFPGYVWHCHMTEHEDFEMMRPLMITSPLQQTVADSILETNDYPTLELTEQD